MADRGKVIKALECCAQMAGNMCRKCPYANECEEAKGLLAGAAHLAADALELLKAQEPKPPRFAVAFDKIYYACDNCGKSLLVVINAEGVKSLDNMPKYCPKCGQAVKWDV